MWLARADSFLMEPVLNLERFSNNAKYLKEGDKYEIFHTFSHWTYFITGARLCSMSDSFIVCERTSSTAFNVLLRQGVQQCL